MLCYAIYIHCFKIKSLYFLQNAPGLSSSPCMLWLWLSEPCMQSVLRFFLLSIRPNSASLESRATHTHLLYHNPIYRFGFDHWYWCFDYIMSFCGLEPYNGITKKEWHPLIQPHILMSSLMCVKPTNMQCWKCIGLLWQSLLELRGTYIQIFFPTLQSKIFVAGIYNLYSIWTAREMHFVLFAVSMQKFICFSARVLSIWEDCHRISFHLPVLHF